MSLATKDRLLDAAERHVRAGGYDAFSFRDLANEIGIKSASVHYHFPSKEALVARLAERYRDAFLADLPAPDAGDPVAALHAAFRTALRRDGLMCLCGTLASQRDALPEAVATEARAFFEALRDWLAAGLGGAAAEDRALAVIARLEGAMMLSRVMEDPHVFDAATADMGSNAK